MSINDLKKSYGKNCIGQVLQIIDDKTVIFSCPFSSSLNLGDKIAIYEICDPIKDVDGTILDNYEYTKDKLEITDISEKYCVAQKNEYVKTSAASFIPAFSPLLEKETVSEVPLKVDKEIISPIHVKHKTIQIGDPVKKVIS